MKYTIIGAAIFMAVSGAANALTITDREADCALGNVAPAGVTCGAGDRRNLDNVELSSMGDGDFFALGLGGSATFWISPDFTGPLSAIEVTFGSSYSDEVAQVYVGNDDDFQLIGTVSNKGNFDGVPLGGTSRLEFAGAFSQIRFVDQSEPGSGRDGFDLDAFNVAAVPLPAAGILLLAGMGGLGGLGALRRRKSKA
ncbi:hypothetical protein [Palleronia sp. LCG004]|uniref:hypothetical protein n=1 Tax=Palleronia sp. LCG004 TaxID=3079304 RepID=UPI002942B566|nr:hypothetical protein [Palleronia sp. LCG004]WOI55571.1 hypothetical protein RVY76_11030 [Palleronia sp. LCG004]